MQQLPAKDHRALPTFMRTLAPNHRATQSLFLSNPDATAREQGPATTARAAQHVVAPHRVNHRWARRSENEDTPQAQRHRVCHHAATAPRVPLAPLQLWVVTEKRRMTAAKACSPTYRFIGFYVVNDIDA